MVFVILLTMYCYNEVEKYKRICNSFSHLNAVPMWEKQLDFTKLNFSNETGNPLGYFVVPNYIHYVNFAVNPVDYIYFICILSVFQNQKPDKIFFHYDNKNVFSGKYWDILEELPGFKDIVVFRHIKIPDKIFNQPINQKWQIWHASDFIRIQILMEYGGIFLESDCYLVKEINNFRRFEIVVSWNKGQSLGNQVIVAHKNARFLKRYLDCFQTYDRTDRYHYADVKPTVEILTREPHLVHRVGELFGDVKLIHKLYGEPWDRWRDMYVIHLLPHLQKMLMIKSFNKMAKFPVIFNETNIAYYPITLRDMAYDVYSAISVKLKWTTQKLDLLYKKKIVLKSVGNVKNKVKEKAKTKVKG